MNSAESNLREALAELVACKDLEERADAGVAAAARKGWIGPSAETHDMLDEYRRRQPLAWEGARRSLAAQPASPASLQEPDGIVSITKPNPSLTCWEWVKHLDLPVGTHSLYATPQPSPASTNKPCQRCHGDVNRCDGDDCDGTTLFQKHWAATPQPSGPVEAKELEDDPEVEAAFYMGYGVEAQEQPAGEKP